MRGSSLASPRVTRPTMFAVLLLMALLALLVSKPVHATDQTQQPNTVTNCGGDSQPPVHIDGTPSSDVTADGKKGGGDQGECKLKPPMVTKQVCCQEGQGVVQITVTNPNHVALTYTLMRGKVKGPSHYIKGGDSYTFVINNVPNGTYKLTVVDDKGNCTEITIKVHCKKSSPSPSPSSASPTPASPSPSESTSSSPSMSPSASPSQSASTSPLPITNVGNSTPTGSLPVTGTPLTTIVIAGAVLIAAGVGFMLVNRRRKATNE